MRLSIAIPALVASAGIALAPVMATTNNEVISENAAQACQLSLPTIDTKVSPRATGFRNDGTANVFVICGTSSPTDDNDFLSGTALWLYSTSVQDVTVNCTFVTGTTGTYVYSTASLSLPAGSDPDRIWQGFPGGAYNVTATCTLPPKVAILRTESTYALNVGA
jgi:hypothetical protein